MSGVLVFKQRIPRGNQGCFEKIKMEHATNETLLNDAPTDTISSAKFSPTSSNFLFVTSWDGVSD